MHHDDELVELLGALGNPRWALTASTKAETSGRRLEKLDGPAAEK